MTVCTVQPSFRTWIEACDKKMFHLYCVSKRETKYSQTHKHTHFCYFEFLLSSHGLILKGDVAGTRRVHVVALDCRGRKPACRLMTCPAGILWLQCAHGMDFAALAVGTAECLGAVCGTCCWRTRHFFPSLSGFLFLPTPGLICAAPQPAAALRTSRTRGRSFRAAGPGAETKTTDRNS